MQKIRRSTQHGLLRHERLHAVAQAFAVDTGAAYTQPPSGVDPCRQRLQGASSGAAARALRRLGPPHYWRWSWVRGTASDFLLRSDNDGMFHIVLRNPKFLPNTGNVIRLATTGCTFAPRWNFRWASP